MSLFTIFWIVVTLDLQIFKLFYPLRDLLSGIFYVFIFVCRLSSAWRRFRALHQYSVNLFRKLSLLFLLCFFNCFAEISDFGSIFAFLLLDWWQLFWHLVMQLFWECFWNIDSRQILSFLLGPSSAVAFNCQVDRLSRSSATSLRRVMLHILQIIDWWQIMRQLLLRLRNSWLYKFHQMLIHCLQRLPGLHGRDSWDERRDAKNTIAF